MKSGSFTLRADDGQSLFVYEWLPSQTPHGVVQIVHGMAEHAARYEDTARALNSAGWAVYAADNRGHGKMTREQDLGHFADHDGWATVLRDLKRVRDEARSRHPEGPFVLMGHSLGSFLVQSFLFTYPGSIDAAVLSGTNGDPGPIALAGAAAALLECMRMGKRGKSKLLDQLSFGKFNMPFKPNRTAFDWLSRDPAQVDRYVADPRCGFMVTTQAWRDILFGLRENARPENLAKIPKNVPIYLFSGAKDPVSAETKGVEKLIAAYRAAGLTELESRFYPDGRHEMVNETNREEVWRDLITWLERVRTLANPAQGRATGLASVARPSAR